ncbi:hypothetical protein GCM10009742_75250 [Kribbella karoonensis]|uniref:Uncharacterized protein n=1 Tax=Kribbella karoonensis TaxID=324851 RepID=A0ABP4QIV6_9ACTN
MQVVQFFGEQIDPGGHARNSVLTRIGIGEWGESSLLTTEEVGTMIWHCFGSAGFWTGLMFWFAPQINC